jgi:hypothetical protein
MAKNKKNKKVIQKAVEVVAPPESNKPAAETTTEPNSTATPEAQQQPAPTPFEPTNEEPPLSGSTSVPDQNVEAVQDNPTELEPSTVAESTSKSETAQLDHVDMSTAAPEEQTVTSMGESQSHLPTEEEPRLSVIEAEEQSHTGPSDASEILPEAPVVTASEESNTLLDGESQAEIDGARPLELPSSTITESVVTESEIIDTNQTGVEAPVTVDANNGSSHLEGINPTEVEIEAERSHEYVRAPSYSLPLN